MYGFRRDSKLNPLITFVLYAGESNWDGPICLHDILDFADVPDKLKNMVSNYRINVIDIRQFENTDVFKTDVKQVFDFIRCSNDKEKLLNLVENDVYFQQMEDDAFDVVTKYTNSKGIVKMKEYNSQGGKKNVCKAIHDLMDDSRKEGVILNKLENAKSLLDVLSDEVIAEKIGLPIDKVKELREQNS